MILCVTLNPCVDKTLVVPAWMPGSNVRGVSTRSVAGGKGNNVARALRGLGHGDVRPVSFFGGRAGELSLELLRSQDGFDPIAIPTAAETRVILTVLTDGTTEQTAFFDPDPAITASEAAALIEAVAHAIETRQVHALTLSGSSPSPATHGTFADLIALAQSRRVPVFLDSYGPALAALWGFWPTAIRINRREAADHLKRADVHDDQIARLLERWAERGVEVAIVTDGAGPVMARIHSQTYRVLSPQMKLVNATGSGDSMLAGLVDAYLARRGGEDLLRHAIACGAANAMTWDAGAISIDDVRRIEEVIAGLRIVG